MTTWVVFDANNLCHRAFHALKEDLSYEGVSTGMFYGVFRDIVTLSHKFATPNIAFCFDCGVPARASKLKTYKSSRKQKRLELPQEEYDRYKAMRQQIRRLRDEILPAMGYMNVFFAEGYEADDCIASFVYGLGKNDRAMVVSSDKDLYQLLAHNIRVYRPVTKEIITEKRFINDYGIPPSRWTEVKAIEGCGTDDVPGIDGVGTKTAVKYLLRQLKTTTKAFQAIEEGKAKWRRNLVLVTLPYPGTPRFQPRPDQVTPETWADTMESFGIKSLLTELPHFPQG